MICHLAGFGQAHPAAPPLREVIGDVHLRDRTDVRERVDRGTTSAALICPALDIRSPKIATLFYRLVFG